MLDPREACSCKKKDCIRHGKCAECIAHHEANRRFPPYCQRKGRKKELEKKKSCRTAEPDAENG